MSEDSRIGELRRRLHKDPASIAFAQLAEELRRAGQCEESIEVCRTGLTTHPAYLSARVTLGLAFIDLNRIEEARRELEHVRKIAPENLAAIRALADIHDRLPGSAYHDEPQNAALLDVMTPLVEPPPVLTVQTVQDTPAIHAEPVHAVETALAGSQEVVRPVEPAGAAPEGHAVRQTENTRALRTVIALEHWLSAIHVARAHRNA